MAGRERDERPRTWATARRHWETATLKVPVVRRETSRAACKDDIKSMGGMERMPPVLNWACATEGFPLPNHQLIDIPSLQPKPSARTNCFSCDWKLPGVRVQASCNQPCLTASVWRDWRNSSGSRLDVVEHGDVCPNQGGSNSESASPADMSLNFAVRHRFDKVDTQNPYFGSRESFFSESSPVH